MIKKILVPLDGSKNSYRGLNEAINLARQCQATIIGIYVNEMLGVYPLHPIGLIGAVSGKEAKKVIEYAKGKCAKNGILFHGKSISGDPPSEIIAFAHKKRNRINIIVIGARGRGVFKGIFLGSVSNYVTHKAKIPVLVVK